MYCRARKIALGIEFGKLVGFPTTIFKKPAKYYSGTNLLAVALLPNKHLLKYSYKQLIR